MAIPTDTVGWTDDGVFAASNILQTVTNLGTGLALNLSTDASSTNANFATISGGAGTSAGIASSVLTIKEIPDGSRRILGMYDDFIGAAGALTQLGSWKIAGASSAIDVAAGHPGIIGLGIGGGNGSSAGMYTNVAMFPTDGIWTVEWDVLIPNLSTSSLRYNHYFGLSDTTAPPISPTGNGAYFNYNDSINGGNWTIYAVNGGVASSTDTGVTVASSTWYKLRVSGDSTNSTYSYSINESTYNGTITTNLPTVGLFPLGVLQKVSGAGSKSAYVDYMSLNQIFNTAR